VPHDDNSRLTPLTRPRCATLAHHSVSKFYVYDDGGDGHNPASRVLQDHIDSGLVKYTNASGSKLKGMEQQLAQFAHCLDHYKRYHKWLAFIDPDEFIVVADQRATIPTILQQFDGPGIGGVVLNWRVFGSSGWDRRPKGGVSNYYTCLPASHSLTRFVKTIVNTAHVAGVGTTAHLFTYKAGYDDVTVKGEPAINDLQERPPQHPTFDFMWLNHYVIKSKEDFELRQERTRDSGMLQRTEEWRAKLDSQATDTCPPLVWRSQGQAPLVV
jgi:hypothetical protein